MSATAAADLIIRTLTEHAAQRAITRELIGALEVCFESKRLPWDAEHDAEIVLMRARKIISP